MATHSNKSIKGFTLIELIVVFSVMAALSTIGIAALVSYSRVQSLQSEVFSLATMLQVAKSRAQSQVTTPNGQTICGTSSLTGYQVSLCSIPGSVSCLPSDVTKYDYAFYAVCGGNLASPALEGKKFPTDIKFGNTTTTFFLFRTLSGGVNGASSLGTQVPVTGYGNTKTITVYASGKIETK